MSLWASDAPACMAATRPLSSSPVNGATVGRNMSREAPPMCTSLALTTSASFESEIPAASASCWPSKAASHEP